MRIPYVSQRLERVLPFLVGGSAAKKKPSIGTIKAISYLLILLPVAFGFLYVHLFGVNVIVRDQWTAVLLFAEPPSGELSLIQEVLVLFRLHNEHRTFFPNIAMLLLGTLTEYSNIAEMYLIQICFLVTLIGLLLVFRDSVRSRLLLFVPVSFIPIAFLVFSLNQYPNMLWGFQIVFAFTQVFSVLALCFLYVASRKGHTKYKRLAFPAALGSGTVAAFSAAPGLFVWPVGVLQLLLSPVEKPAKKRLIVTWSLVGVGVWALYLVGYNTARSPRLLYFLEHFVAGTQYFLILLGNSLFREPIYAFISGLALVGLIALSLFLIHKDRKWGENSFWVALLLFSFFTLAAITLGKPNYGSGIPGVASRYATFSILAVVSAYAMLAKQAFEKKTFAAIVVFGGLCLLVLSSVPLSYERGVAGGKETEAENRKAAFILATHDSQPDESLELLYKRPELIRSYGIPTLETLGYNVFSESRQVLPPPLSELSPVPPSAPSEVESISGVRVDLENQPLVISAEEQSFIEITGWAMGTEDVAGGVYVDIDGKPFPAFYGVEREDLVDRFRVPSYRNSGFERTIPVSEIGTGPHELSIVVLTEDSEGYYRSEQEEIAFEIK